MKCEYCGAETEGNRCLYCGNKVNKNQKYDKTAQDRNDHFLGNDYELGSKVSISIDMPENKNKGIFGFLKN